MTIKESLERINRIQSKLQINYDRIQSAIQISTISLPSSYIQNISQIRSAVEANSRLNIQLSNMTAMFNEPILHSSTIAEIQQSTSFEAIRNSLSEIARFQSIKFNSFNIELSDDSFIKLNDISNLLINEIEEFEVPDEYVETKQNMLDSINRSNQSLTFSNFVQLIASIFTIISFIMTAAPNRNQEMIIDSLNQLAEIQQQQIVLLEEISNSLEQENDQSLLESEISDDIYQKY